MKEILSAILITVFSLFTTQFSVCAQCTPDDQYNELGAYPSSLPSGCVGSPYNETIHFVYPNDTTYAGFEIDVDSVQITSIDGVPDGLNYECNQPDCKYIPEQEINRGCMAVSGTPSEPKDPADSLVIHFRYWASSQGQVVTDVDSFKVSLEVNEEGNCTTSTDIFGATNPDMQIDLYPNPLTSGKDLRFVLNRAGSFSIGFYNAIGKQVLSIEEKSYEAGTYVIKGHYIRKNLIPGMYFVKFRFEDGNSKESIVKKLSVTE